MKIAWSMLVSLLLLTPALSAEPYPSPRIEQARARATPPGIEIGAGYLTITNLGKLEDELVAVETPLAARTEVHDTSIDASGVMRMRALPTLRLPPGVPVRLEPGGSHLMLMGLRGPLRPGMRVPLTLRFRLAPPLTVELLVQALE